MAEFVKEANEFGFTHLELNSALTPQKLSELLEIEGISISSVHCPCPVIKLPNGSLSNHPQLSSPDKETRFLAIDFAKKTIELASKVGARAVVLHAGLVEVDFYLERDLHAHYKKGKTASVKFWASRSWWSNAAGAEP